MSQIMISANTAKLPLTDVQTYLLPFETLETHPNAHYTNMWAKSEALKSIILLNGKYFCLSE